MHPTAGGEAHFVSIKASTLQKWHERLGHVNFQDLIRMVDINIVDDMKLANRKVTFCIHCAEAKQAKRKQPQQDTSRSAPTDEPGATLCADLKTDMKADRRGNINTIVDHATGFNGIYL